MIAVEDEAGAEGHVSGAEDEARVVGEEVQCAFAEHCFETRDHCVRGVRPAEPVPREEQLLRQGTRSKVCAREGQDWACDVACEVEVSILGFRLSFGDGPLRAGEAAAGEREACPWGTEATVSKSGLLAMTSSKRR